MGKRNRFMNIQNFFLLTVLGSITSIFIISTPANGEEMRSVGRSIFESSQKTVVTIKLVMNLEFAGREEEEKAEVIGTIIDPSGLTVLSAYSLDPGASIKLLADSMGGAANGAPSFDTTIRQAYFVMEDGIEIEAEVVLKDTDLDIGFVRPREPGRVFPAANLISRGKPPQVLEDIFVVSRLSRGANREPAVSLGMIRAEIKGPRPFYMCDEQITVDGLGCIAYAADGASLGLIVTKQNKDFGAGRMSALLGMLMGGGLGRATPFLPILRPVEDVLELAKQAKASPSQATAQTEATDNNVLLDSLVEK